MSTPALPPRLARALGVTRVARVTGLDRTGVEVACAVRPGGHVLQVCQGKGATREAAAAGALLETAELWAAEHPERAALRWGAAEELAAEAWGPERLGAAPAPGERLAWVEAARLGPGGGRAWVPAHAVFCPPATGPLLGPARVPWTSNGSGAHPERDRALVHALTEAVERDALARALPHGWTRAAVRARLLAPASLPPAARALVARLEARGFRAHLLDGGPRAGGVGLPVAAALLVDLEEGPVPLTAGYACGLTREGALVRALLEAAQSRLTDIHGAREDVAPMDRDAAATLARWCAEAPPARPATALPDFTRDARSGAAALRRVVRALAEAGRRDVAVVDLPPPVPGLHVVRAVVPGLRVSELL